VDFEYLSTNSFGASYFEKVFFLLFLDLVLISIPLPSSSVLFLVNLGITSLIRSIIFSALYKSIFFGKLILINVPFLSKENSAIGTFEASRLDSKFSTIFSSKKLKESN